MRPAFGLLTSLALANGLALAAAAPSAAAPQKIVYADQGPKWDADLRRAFYDVDQGSELIPFAWLEALRQADGKPFLDGSLARYGFLPRDDPATAGNLPIGFVKRAGQHGTFVGVGCAACHVRQITVGDTAYRFDGGPSFNDFAPFVTDLDVAMGRVRNDPATFDAFAHSVLGDKARDKSAVEILRTEVDLWWVRYHTFIDKSLPKDARVWGPGRMDAISLIYNRLAGLDVGPPPTYLIPGNMVVGHAPVRYPFLWGSARQDMTQWTGFAANGNEFYALARNLGEEYGVFGRFHPQKTTGSFTLFDRNYLSENSANLSGLVASENFAAMMGAPVWPGPIDRMLASTGEIIFQRPTDQGGCAACHGIAPGEKRADAPPELTPSWRTPVMDVGTDRQAWNVVMRDVETGSMEGASIQGLVEPLRRRDMVISLLRAAVVGAILEDKKIEPQRIAEDKKTDSPKQRIADMARDRVGLSLLRAKAAAADAVGLGPPPPPPLVVNGYEARVLKGIWAAAPYLHNGSVPSLAELLTPPAQRLKSFKLGPAYDLATIGLAKDQPAVDFTLKTTGCEDLYSGDSNCGHDYGTRLSAEEKRALLEYIKTL